MRLLSPRQYVHQLNKLCFWFLNPYSHAEILLHLHLHSAFAFSASFSPILLVWRATTLKFSSLKHRVYGTQVQKQNHTTGSVFLSLEFRAGWMERKFAQCEARQASILDMDIGKVGSCISLTCSSSLAWSAYPQLRGCQLPFTLLLYHNITEKIQFTYD